MKGWVKEIEEIPSNELLDDKLSKDALREALRLITEQNILIKQENTKNQGRINITSFNQFMNHEEAFNKVTSLVVDYIEK
jgi:hypothetical protein